MKRFSLFFVFFMLYFSGCLSFRERPGPLEPMEEPVQEESLSWEILDYRNRAAGAQIPPWLHSFLEGGIAAVEKLEEFANYYVFISMNSGTSISALEQWNTGFSPDLDFARLAAVRIENRFMQDARRYPDDEYGSYFIALIRSASDALWEGAVREDDFWLLRYFTSNDDDDDTAAGWESYDFFILVKVEKASLISQITRLLESVGPETPLSTDQQHAVNRVRERFFEGF